MTTVSKAQCTYVICVGRGAHVVAGTGASAGRKGARMMRSDVPCVFAFRVHLQCVADSFFAELEIRVRFGLSMGNLHHGMAGMDKKAICGLARAGTRMGLELTAC